MASGSAELVRAGREAMARAAWSTARDYFTEALADEESAEAHWRLGQALWFLNDLEPSLAHHRTAYRLYRAAGDATAARIAAWIAADHAGVYGDLSVARGWLARAAGMVEGGEPTPALGYYLMTRAMLDGDYAGQEAAGRAALELGRSLRDGDLEVCGLLVAGQGLVLLGLVPQGMAMVEEGMAAVVAGEVSDPTVAADCFCFMLGTCDIVGDYELAEQWVRAATGYTAERACPFVAAQCAITYAGVLIGVGRWAAAEDQLLAALRVYDVGHRGLGPGVAARLAELRIRQGALEEAEDLLAGIEGHPAAQLPLARMHLVRGDPAGALALIGASLPDGAVQLTELPPVRVGIEACLAAGDRGRAAVLAEGVLACADRTGGQVLRAEALLWAGQAAAPDDPARAAALLAEAAAACPYPASWLAGRIHLARAQLAGDPAAALVEARAALGCFRALEARADVDACLQLLRSLGSPTRIPEDPAQRIGALSRREREVAALVGVGMSNPQIAARLYLSPRTVEHHVGHIFTKLGLTSRSALAAYAARNRAAMGEFPDVGGAPPGAHSPRNPSRQGGPR